MKYKNLLPKVKLKHLGKLSQKDIKVDEIMSDVMKFENNWWNRVFTFANKFKTAFLLAQAIRHVDLSKLELPKNSNIKVPKNIDFISFQAMMELQSVMTNASEDDNITEVIANIITISTYSDNNDKDYDSDSDSFKQYKDLVLNSSLIDMFGIYNWICRSIEESAKMWNERFMSVQLIDEDYEQAGGNRMSQFNVITTIKSVCQDFNLPFEKAWQLSYNLIQTNSYAKATQNHIQDQMRVLKEQKMKASKSNGPV